MHCPSCYTRLEIADRAGIEIDFCPSCRGVWLEKGELDKIIERSAEHFSGAAKAVRPERTAVASSSYREEPYGGQFKEKQKKKKKKREWLEDIFDIFD